MDSNTVRKLVTFLERNCDKTLTPGQIERLNEIKNMPIYNIYKVRILYRIAIDNLVYPECPYCKQPIQTQDDLTIDHIIPRAKGGTDSIENLQPMHKLCNTEKGCVMPENVPCEEAPAKKHRRHRSKHIHKEREIVKSRTPEELYQKCKKIDQMRANKCHANIHGHWK